MPSEYTNGAASTHSWVSGSRYDVPFNSGLLSGINLGQEYSSRLTTNSNSLRILTLPCRAVVD